MGNYPGAQSPKPLIALSNSPFISGLNNGPMTKVKRESFATKTTCAPAACNACLPTLGPAILPNCHQVYTTIPKARRDLLATRTLPPPSSCASDGLDWGIGRYTYIYIYIATLTAQALDLNMIRLFALRCIQILYMYMLTISFVFHVPLHKSCFFFPCFGVLYLWRLGS